MPILGRFLILLLSDFTAQIKAIMPKYLNGLLYWIVWEKHCAGYLLLIKLYWRSSWTWIFLLTTGFVQTGQDWRGFGILKFKYLLVIFITVRDILKKFHISCNKYGLTIPCSASGWVEANTDGIWHKDFPPTLRFHWGC